MKNDKKKFHRGKNFFNKDSVSTERKERPFEKFRKRNADKNKDIKKENISSENRDEKSNKKWQKPSAGEGGKFYTKDAESTPGKERPFEKFRKKYTGRRKHFDKEKISYSKENEKPGKRWEKPSVFFKKKREESENKKLAVGSGSWQQKESEINFIRLNKYISNAGLCSRREADNMIENGLVEVNGKIVTQLGTKIGRDDVVKYGGETLRKERNVYVLMNKPKDYITTAKDTHDRKTVMELVKNACKERIYPVGRLDRNTTGVLLLTNDGELTKKLTHPKYGAKKIYHVETDKNVSHPDLQKLTEGILLEEDGMVKADEANYAGEHLDKNQIGVVLHSGKNRVVRKMFEALGYRVNKLDRVYFAGLTKKDLPRGRWRFLSEKEVGFLKMIRPPRPPKGGFSTHM